MRKNPVYRIRAVNLEGECLHVQFSDGAEGFVRCGSILPRTGIPDWSRISLRMKGAHIAVPVSGGEFEEHEIPWDVLRGFVDPEFSLNAGQPIRRKSGTTRSNK